MRGFSNWALTGPWMWPCCLVSIPALDWNGKSRLEIRLILIYLCWVVPCFAWPSGGLALYRWVHGGGAPLPRHTQGGWNVQHTARTNGVWEGGGMSCLPQYTSSQLHFSNSQPRNVLSLWLRRIAALSRSQRSVSLTCDTGQKTDALRWKKKGLS